MASSSLYIREFLDARDPSSPAHVLVTVQENQGTLQIGDGYNSVTLDFPADTWEERVASRERCYLLRRVLADLSDCLDEEPVDLGV